MSRQGSIPGRPSIPDPSEDQIRTHACELIELVRNQSGLSYNLAQDTIHSVLTYISTNFTRLDRNVPGLYYFSILCDLSTFFPMIRDFESIIN